jgi:hypothetical protein
MPPKHAVQTPPEVSRNEKDSRYRCWSVHRMDGAAVAAGQPQAGREHGERRCPWCEQRQWLAHHLLQCAGRWRHPGAGDPRDRRVPCKAQVNTTWCAPHTGRPERREAALPPPVAPIYTLNKLKTTTFRGSFCIIDRSYRMSVLYSRFDHAPSGLSLFRNGGHWPWPVLLLQVHNGQSRLPAG